MPKRNIVLYVVLCLLVSGTIYAQSDSLNIRMIGAALGSYARTFDYDEVEEILYISSGLSLISYDVSDITDHIALDTCTSVMDICEDIDIIHDYDGRNIAITSNRIDGINIFDVTDPSNMFKIGHHSTYGWAQEIEIHENYVFVFCQFSGVELFDITDPENPEFVSRYPSSPETQIGRIAVKYPYVVFADFYEGIEVLDYSNPSMPLFIENLEYEVEYRNCDVCFNGNYIYATTDAYPRENAYIETFIMDSTGHSLHLGFIPANGRFSPSYLSILDNRLFHFGQTCTDIFNISNPESLYCEGRYHYFDYYLYDARFFDITSSYEFVWEARYDRFQILDISDPDTGIIIYDNSLCLYNDEVVDADINDSLIFVAFHDVNCDSVTEPVLKILRIADLPNPPVISEYPIEKAFKVIADDSIVYVLGDSLHILNVSNPEFPIQINSVYIDTVTKMMKLHKSECGDLYLYILQHFGTISYYDSLDTMIIIDVSNPESLEMSKLHINVCSSFDIYGEGLYLTSGRIFDISEPMEPVFICQNRDLYGSPYMYNDTIVFEEIEEDRICHLEISNIANLEEPELLSRTLLSDTTLTIDAIYDVVLDSCFVTVIHGNSKIDVYDVSNLESPEIVGYYKGAWHIYNPKIKNQMFLATNGIYGIHIFDLSAVYEPDTSYIQELTPEDYSIGLNLSPNPFNSALEIDTQNLDGVEIYDVQGKIIWKKNMVRGNNKKILWKPEDNIQSGVYLVRGIGAGEVKNGKACFIK